METMKLAKYRYNCITNTLYLSEKFYSNASQYDSAEYQLIQSMKKELPGLKIQIEVHKKSKTPKDAHLSIKAMQRYINLTRNSENGMNELNRVIEANKALNHSLKETRKWFKERYPRFGSVPRFDADGYLITDAEKEGDKN